MVRIEFCGSRGKGSQQEARKMGPPCNHLARGLRVEMGFFTGCYFHLTPTPLMIITGGPDGALDGESGDTGLCL